MLFIGAAHVDRFGQLAAPAILGKSNPGQFFTQAGGACLNVASNVRAFGGKVSICSITGSDEAGNFVRSVCAERGLTTHLQKATAHTTATYTSVVEPGGDLTIALADMAIYDSFDAALATGLMSAADCQVVCVDANLPALALETISAIAKPRLAALTVSAAKTKRLLSSLAHLNILLTNKAEAQVLLQAAGLGQFSTPEDMLSPLASLGPETIIVSNGGAPVWFQDKGITGSVTPRPAIPLVDVTGGGDALAAGVLFRLQQGDEIASAVEFGVQAAQKVLEVKGPWRSDLRAVMNGDQ